MILFFIILFIIVRTSNINTTVLDNNNNNNIIFQRWNKENYLITSFNLIYIGIILPISYYV